LNAAVGRAAAFAKGEISNAPAGGCEVRVAVEAPGGSPVAVAERTDPNVTTIRPEVR
jgi:hypothetical protein